MRTGGLDQNWPSLAESRAPETRVSNRESRIAFRALGRIRANEEEDGGAEGDRTPDLDIANVALSQLRYCPARVARNMGRGREDCHGGPATSALLAPARADG